MSSGPGECAVGRHPRPLRCPRPGLESRRIARHLESAGMKITVVGAGAMGGSYGGLLAVAGHEVQLIDAWLAHVEAINREGLRVDGVRGDHRVRLAASTGPIGAGADMVIVFVDANNTGAAAATARELLAPDGLALTLQKGIGNVEKL